MDGIPQQQGSKTRWGSEENTHLKPWRYAVAAEAKTWMHDGPIREPVAVLVAFVFPRPKSHYGTGSRSETLKISAPHWHSSPPDLDKLLRAIGDALTGIVVHNDSQIVRWTATKTYGVQPRARITVQTLT